METYYKDCQKLIESCNIHKVELFYYGRARYFHDFVNKFKEDVRSDDFPVNSSINEKRIVNFTKKTLSLHDLGYSDFKRWEPDIKETNQNVIIDYGFFQNRYTYYLQSYRAETHTHKEMIYFYIGESYILRDGFRKYIEDIEY